MKIDLPDGIEIHSLNMEAEDGARIHILAERLSLPLLCNSDAHRAEEVGVYHNVLPRAPVDGKDLARIVRANGCQCGKL